MRFEAPSWPPECSEVRQAVIDALDSREWGRYHSTLCDHLQSQLQSLFAVPEVRLCCSGTVALEIALRAAKIGSGDEVILSAYDYPGNLRTVELLGAKPVLLDVSPGSLTFSSDALELAAERSDSGSVSAVIVSHLFGEVVETKKMRAICDRVGWTLIEDVCQSVGATHSSVVNPTQAVEDPDQQEMVGTNGHLATLSFGGSKPLTAGAGGALVINERSLAARLGSWLERPSDVYPLSPLQAAVLGPQLEHLARMRARRNENWKLFREHRLGSYPHWEWVVDQKPGRIANPYKISWLAQSATQRARVIELAETFGLPIGAGYRSFAKTSERRCRKITSCEHARELGERLFVLDHRALLRDPAEIESLVRAFDSLYEASVSA